LDYSLKRSVYKLANRLNFTGPLGCCGISGKNKIPWIPTYPTGVTVPLDQHISYWSNRFHWTNISYWSNIYILPEQYIPTGATNIPTGANIPLLEQIYPTGANIPYWSKYILPEQHISYRSDRSLPEQQVYPTGANILLEQIYPTGANISPTGATGSTG
jgi:hypothetical protein